MTSIQLKGEYSPRKLPWPLPIPKPSACENCTHLPQSKGGDSLQSLFNNATHNGSGMNVNINATIAPTFGHSICPEAAYLSHSDVASTPGVTNWFDSLWTPLFLTEQPTQNTMVKGSSMADVLIDQPIFPAHLLLSQPLWPAIDHPPNIDGRFHGKPFNPHQTRTLVVPSSPSQSTASNPRVHALESEITSFDCAQRVNSHRAALSPMSIQPTNEEDAPVPSFRCPWSKCTLRFMSPEEAFLHAVHHPGRRTLICPHTGCPYTSVRIADVKRHCRTASHGQPASFLCRGCKRMFTRKDAVRRHQLQSAKDPQCVAYAGSDAGVGIGGKRGWRRQ
ncbi:uncharacterized protein BT62DRAFT_757273 [Guyanagaster necrorhizus]|uniref:C2H2-type domain-containing protein n=1 Tax=Guyanagaster necrorhizus TaxID=856835 RepID=A0A9P7VWG4_9AGAR|nr:uncharacterized protein BT62DRAFT_757273 [Guyanagaster necrorhizus MCA 3950]KAG7448172.1 hypothetical protein BT62DRAFT_757273 [Guyanagaster necrorhizus MCA 3950]